MAMSVASSTTSEMGVPLPTSASYAVDHQLKTLCLREFPCGLGQWREPEPLQIRPPKGKEKYRPYKSKKKDDTESLESIKLNAKKDKSEALQELVSSHFSPWHLDYSWSEEAKKLREIAVKSPWLIDQNFVLNYFKTLRIVDKNVSDVDEDLLMLKNLEELTLSANFIKNVNSKNLPTSLKVLELCANQISDISGLCVHPPLLTHLGLGHNKISFLGDYITGDFWPHLLSLDLSHNDLCDLMDIIRKMISLPRLRTLLLQGNPLSLIPGYRGYTVDSLRHLSIMDDVHISADEKHHFKGLSRRREFILDEAKVQIGVAYLKGLPCPEEIKHPGDQPDFPVVERSYFVQFMFPEEHVVRTAEAGDRDELELTLEMEAAAGQGGEAENMTARTDTKRTLDLATEPTLPSERRVEINSRPEVQTMKAPPTTTGSIGSFPRPNPNLEPGEVQGSEFEAFNLDLVEGSQAGEAEEEKKTAREATPVPEPAIKLAPVNTEPQPWSEEIELNWTVDLTRDDLLTLRDFFRQGMDFSVVEQVVLGYPPEDGEEGKGPEAKASKDKPKDPPAKGGKGSAKDKGKKRKEPGMELVRSPPTFTTIATFHITLDHFLESEFEYQNIFTKGDVPPPSTIRSMDPDEPKKDEAKAESGPNSQSHEYENKKDDTNENKTMHTKKLKFDKNKNNKMSALRKHLESLNKAEELAMKKRNNTLPSMNGMESPIRKKKTNAKKFEIFSPLIRQMNLAANPDDSNRSEKSDDENDFEKTYLSAVNKYKKVSEWNKNNNALKGKQGISKASVSFSSEIGKQDLSKASVSFPSSIVKVDKKDSKDKKKADKGVDKKNASNNAKDAKKSPRAEKAEKGGKGGKGKAEEAEEDEGPPPPLELEVTVKLHHWKTAMDSVKEEEERARAAMEPKGMGSKVGSKVDLTSRKNSVKP